MSYDTNPFSGICLDRAAIWDMLVRRDIEAFLAADWSMIEADFHIEGFFGLDAGKNPDPAHWGIRFSDCALYRDEWRRQAAEMQNTANMARARKALFRATDLSRIEITGNTALAHKTFDGEMPVADSGSERLNWQTLYICRSIDSVWKIASFVGYMKHKED